MYLLATRAYLAYLVCLVSRYMERPTEIHLIAAKRILRYLRGIVNLGILYKMNDELVLQGWSGSDYVGDCDDRKNTTWYVFKLGSSPISWSLKKQFIVTLSSTEVEFVAASSCACQAMWLQRILHKLGETQNQGTIIICDNSSTIKLSKNPVMHGRYKHINVRFYFLRDLTKDDTIEMKHCNTEEQIRDVLTKPVKLETLNYIRARLGMCVI